MRKQMKLFITLILVLALALSMTACNNTPTPTPTPDPTVTPTVEPTVKPTVEPTVKPTKKPHGGGSIPWPDNPTPVAKTWDGEAALTGSGTYTYIGDKATPVASPDFTGKLIVNDIASLTLVMPKASVEVAGTVGTLVATTGPNTLTFKDGSVVNVVTVNGGNVDVQKGAIVGTNFEVNSDTTDRIVLDGTMNKVVITKVKDNAVLKVATNSAVKDVTIAVGATTAGSTITVTIDASVKLTDNAGSKVNVETSEVVNVTGTANTTVDLP